MQVKKPKASFVFPVTAPAEYAHKVINALNCGDYEDIDEALQKLCASNVTIAKHFYPSTKELRVQDENNKQKKRKDEDYITTNQFSCMSEFIQYMKLWNAMIPDGSYSVQTARLCYEGPTSVFIISYQYSGTLLCNQINMLAKGFAQQTELSIQSALNQACSITQANNVNYRGLRQLSTEGSIALYVNPEGLITTMEMFETRRDFY